MPLPKIVTPSYELTLPSNGKKIKYRPFLVKEEKILILAIEGGDMKDITTAIKDVLSNCILSQSCSQLGNVCSADMNADGGSNVLDIVVLINCILLQNCGN